MTSVATPQQELAELRTELARWKSEASELQSENLALRLLNESLEGACRRAAEDLRQLAEEITANLETRARALLHEADRVRAVRQAGGD